MKLNINLKDYSAQQPFINRLTSLGLPVYFGQHNLFTEDLLRLFTYSPLQRSILDNKQNYIFGAGITISSAVTQPNLKETWSEFMKKCIADYVIFEAFAVQVILNKDGKHFSFYHQPVDQVRLGQYNDLNIIEEAYINANWRYRSNLKPIKMFGTETPQQGERYLLYFKEYVPGELYYAIPSWYSAANWIEADIALSRYYNNFINNNFNVNTVITYPSQPDEEQQDALYDNLQKCFTGSGNAGSLLLLFGENGTLPDIKNLSTLDADLYNTFSDQVLKYIVSLNKLTSPLLAGLHVGNQGFSSNKDEVIAAFELYNKTVIYKSRSFILDNINWLLTLNGFNRVISIEDFVMFPETKEDEKENDAVEDETNNIEADDISNTIL